MRSALDATATLSSARSPSGESGVGPVEAGVGASPDQPFLPGLDPDSADSLTPPEAVLPPGSLAREATAGQAGPGQRLAHQTGWYLLGVLCGCGILVLIALVEALIG